jgi:DNA-binding winged helix-turn-helix (wHTH) protein/tetratricopeptide (TPR) repeat protein
VVKEFPPFRLDDVDQSLWREGRRIRLTPKAYALLHYLVEHAGTLVTQEDLLEALWPDTFVQPEVLKSQILDVRAALGDRPKNPSFIETVPRRGYRFIAPVSEVSAAPHKTPPPSPGPVRRIVGRGEALENLQAGFARALDGERQVIFVTGEQGIGKSTIVDAFLAGLDASRATILRGQCLESFGTAKEPYYPILEALGQLARSSADVLARNLASYAPTWLVRFPALVRPEDREHLQRELVGATPGRMIREMCELLEQLADAAPLLLLFEDLHWSDPSTVDVLVSVARRRTPARLLLIGTYRPVDVVLAQHPLKVASHSLKVNHVSREIALSPLDETQVADYLAGADASRDPPVAQLAHWVRKQTDGNPLFMVTVIEHLRDRGHIIRDAGHWTITTPLHEIGMVVPETLRELIELQIDRLSATQRQVLDAASVHGASFSSVVTASVLDIDAESVEEACFELARNQHIVRNADVGDVDRGAISQRFEFVHAAFRTVIYQRLAPARRAKLHRRFGDAIERLAGDARAEHAVELAGHFERCGEWGRTIEYHRLAAQHAWKRFDYRAAVATLDHALKAASHLPEAERGPTEASILWMLAVVLQALHDTPRVMPTLEAVAARAAASGSVETEVRAILASVFFRSREDANACRPLLEQADRLIARLETEPARNELAAVATVARIVLFGWDPAVATQHDQLSAAMEHTADRVSIAATRQGSSVVQLLASRYRESLQNARDSLGPMLENGRLVLYFQGREVVAANLRMLGRWGEALDMLDEAILGARKNESGFRLAMALVLKASVHLEAMDYEGVLNMCHEAAPWLNGSFIRDRNGVSKQLSAAATLGLGRVDDALSQLLDLRRTIDERPVAFSWSWRIPLQIALGDAWLAKGDRETARSEVDAALALVDRTREVTWQSRAWEASARLAIVEGDRDRAGRDLARGFAAIENRDSPLAAWRLHATAARLGLRDHGSSHDHHGAGQEIVTALAASLESRPVLRERFLSAALVSRPEPV